ncbi:MAG: hypothetical protein ACR2M4_05610 [Actinomycetota bacterium]
MQKTSSAGLAHPQKVSVARTRWRSHLDGKSRISIQRNNAGKVVQVTFTGEIPAFILACAGVPVPDAGKRS